MARRTTFYEDWYTSNINSAVNFSKKLPKNLRGEFLDLSRSLMDFDDPKRYLEEKRWSHKLNKGVYELFFLK